MYLVDGMQLFTYNFNIFENLPDVVINIRIRTDEKQILSKVIQETLKELDKKKHPFQLHT